MSRDPAISQALEQTVSHPLYVDLDGTLVKSDTLLEGIVACIRERPSRAITLLPELLRGRAGFKAVVAGYSRIDPRHLPYNDDVLEMVRSARASGRRVVLATAANHQVALAIADHVGFDAILASDETTNLKGTAKLQAILEDARGPFDYIGDSEADVVILARAEGGLRIRRSPDLTLRAIVRLMRPHQWAKNLLVFVAPMMAHQILRGSTIAASAFAFGAFCLCASGVYAINDLLDVASDREHPSKRRRPLASGDVSLATAALLGIGLLAAGLCIAAITLPPAFVLLLAGYVLTTQAYSMWLKRIAIVDVMVLAALYGVRVFGGALATNVPLSAWLLGFAGFLFLSLAFVKRYAELVMWRALGKTSAGGRDYSLSDASLVRSFGTTSAYSAGLVLALYVSSDGVRQLYAQPAVLWLVSPLIMFWISRMWLLAHRDELRGDDPLLFALRDRASYAIGIAVALVFLAAHPL